MAKEEEEMRGREVLMRRGEILASLNLPQVRS